MTAWKNKYINHNKFSRPMTKLTAVRKVVVHYTANHGAGADNHYRYFNNLNGRYASAHLFVDKIEALCIIPLNEVAYHANDGTYRGVPELLPNANFLSIGVEMCQEKDGSFHPDTIRRTENVVAELCRRYKLDPVKDVVRHFDVTKKMCPAPWVSNPSAFTKFKNNVKAKLKGGTSAPSTPTKPSNKDWLQKGDKGSSVVKLQKDLISLGYSVGSHGSDGVFGDGTLNALKRFQKDYKLVVDGLYGQASQKAMRDAIKAKKGDLTMSQYKELKKLIDSQNKEIASLKKKLEHNNRQTPSTSHEQSTEWAKRVGLTVDGRNPLHPLQREQAFTMFQRFYDELIDHSDKEASKDFAEDIVWAIENGISNGVRPQDFAKRQEVIAMLHRSHEVAQVNCNAKCENCTCECSVKEDK